MEVYRRGSLNAQHIKPCIRWATAEKKTRPMRLFQIKLQLAKNNKDWTMTIEY